MRIKAKIDTRQFEKALNDMSRNMNARVVGEALEYGAQPIWQQATNNVHVITGRLKRSLRVYGWEAAKGTVSVKIGTPVIYARVEEEGHIFQVTPRQRAFLHTIGIHLRSTTRQIVRQPHPYLRPAFWAKRREALQLVVRKLRDSL